MSTLYQSFPLGLDARLLIALRIQKAALIPLVPDRLIKAGFDPMESLPASSPVRKQGFEPDARAAWRMMARHPDLFAATDTPQKQQSAIRTLSRFRDRWAHQQLLTEDETRRFLLTGAELLETLAQAEEAFALRALAHPPVDRLGELQAILSQLPLSEAPDFESLALHLDMEAGDSSDATKLRALLVWSAASDLIAARPPNALNVIQGGKRAIYLGWSITLDHTASWTY
ncbi:Swt1 family HEPN domain-containing protein [Ponticaulis sp.]|uniref:Swt1 family HEPN domain-containing protein n=1 Tax=Ponticaulis sp. TaxID=2020902 RepID=UPI000B6E6329|nr:Swt1 family HEPN domain-containing protein [Ponticaulis sp.]MAI90453.1 hypothetical protein [Ponticaulis sp.]OUY00152.1 MAG: hypothetical protein CBB65_08440 [Hyphomonadaceae bacterium TMED5]|tara:strand:- start:69620 stop:70306 length:687 start_codon:yes stop_codon:yes gene_type:complete